MMMIWTGWTSPPPRRKIDANQGLMRALKCPEDMSGRRRNWVILELIGGDLGSDREFFFWLKDVKF